MKGIVLAGGAGTRLRPLTKVVSKQLMPVYDKPMVYYPLSALMLAGIRDVLLISTPGDLPRFRRLLGDGSRLGMRFAYAEQAVPEGPAHALVLAREFVAGSPACLVLGDNLFYGHGFTEAVRAAAGRTRGATIFAYRVRDPQHYGVVEFDRSGRATSLEEKPARPRGTYAVPGIYFYDGDACAIAASLAPSERGELEITDLNRRYLERGDLRVERLGRGIAWFDTGTHRSLLDAGNFIAAIEERQGLKVGCLEEIAFAAGWIGADSVRAEADEMGPGAYGDYLRDLVRGAAAGS